MVNEEDERDQARREHLLWLANLEAEVLAQPHGEVTDHALGAIHAMQQNWSGVPAANPETLPPREEEGTPDEQHAHTLAMYDRWEREAEEAGDQQMLDSVARLREVERQLRDLRGESD